MLPLDVGNQRESGHLPMKDLWYAVYALDAAMCVIIIPFAIFYYEGEDGAGEVYVHQIYRVICRTTSNRISGALRWTFMLLFVFLFVFLLSYFLWNVAEIPFQNLLSESLDVSSPKACGDYVGGDDDVCVIYSAIRQEMF